MAGKRLQIGLYSLALLVLTGCERCQDDVLPCATPNCSPAATPYSLEIPAFFPPMDIPEDNPLTVEGIELGRMLFWEKDLSADGSMSCGSCHLPSAGFSDPNPYSTGITGARASAMPWPSSTSAGRPPFWDGRAVTLEEQILEPVSHPDEMALPWSEAVERLQNSEDYTARFAVAFGDDVITPERTTQAIAQFLRPWFPPIPN